MDGRNIIGYQLSEIANEFMKSFSPGLKRTLEGQFHKASQEDIQKAMDLSHRATQPFAQKSGKEKAAFLRAIAEEIMELGDDLVSRAMKESGLPEGRIRGERGRTVGQLELFAKLVEEGSWVNASIDLPIPDRRPVPKADIRSMLIPIGPVVVYTASNFPLAFSTAGGDTASALAGGNPVIVKAHESHLGTNALVALAIQKAADRTGMPDGVFSSLNGTGPELGQQLAKHPLTKAIAFTGSFKAGKAIFDTVAQRRSPIPVFAEMGSINPVLLLPNLLKEKSEELAQQLSQSVTLGVGQFCTNPGLIIGIESPALTSFSDHLNQHLSNYQSATMLNEQVCKNYYAGKKHLTAQEGVQLLNNNEDQSNELKGVAACAVVSADDFLKNPNLQEEVFGPFTLIVNCQNQQEIKKVVEKLQGQLTGSVFGDDDDFLSFKAEIELLQAKVGRIIFNGAPTGVEVCHSMHHGGPYPATTDSRFTSVGTQAILRFVRLLAFQNYLPEMLHPALQDENPLGIWRTIDGVKTKNPIARIS